jgi:hypothetical protein
MDGRGFHQCNASWSDSYNGVNYDCYCNCNTPGSNDCKPRQQSSSSGGGVPPIFDGSSEQLATGMAMGIIMGGLMQMMNTDNEAAVHEQERQRQLQLQREREERELEIARQNEFEQLQRNLKGLDSKNDGGSGSCIKGDETVKRACTLNGTPCCPPYRCEGKFPNTYCVLEGTNSDKLVMRDIDAGGGLKLKPLPKTTIGPASSVTETLILSNQLGQKASQISAGDLEGARELAQKSADAMTKPIDKSVLPKTGASPMPQSVNDMPNDVNTTNAQAKGSSPTTQPTKTLILSNQLGQKAAQATVAGDPESAREKAELSAQALTVGGLGSGLEISVLFLAEAIFDG